MKALGLLVIGLGGMAVAQNSPLNAAGWGRESSAGDATSHGMGDSGMARRSDRLYDLRMPARSALDTLTSFSAQMTTGRSTLDDGVTEGTVTGFQVPQISLSIPMRRWGALGGAYWQRFSKSYEITSSSGEMAKGEGGSYEFVGSYSLRMPFLPWVAAGASYHKLLGRDRQMQTAVYDNSDLYYVAKANDTIETRRDGGYWGGSLWMTQPDWDLGVWTSLSGDVDVTVHHNNSSEFTTATSRDSVISTPFTIGTDGVWRITPRQMLSADLRYTDWSSSIAKATDAWFVGAGWEYQGHGDRFDSYWKRMAFRLGSYTEIGGADELSTAAATMGVGLPLGSMGTLDLAFQAGKIFNAHDQPKLEETFYRFYVSLTGANLWGNPSRRRH